VLAQRRVYASEVRGKKKACTEVHAFKMEGKKLLFSLL
jgi:hypothetical protein